MRAAGETRREEARGVEPLEAREVSSRGGARGEQSRSSSSAQAHQTRQMGLNSGRQRQHCNDGDGTARGNDGVGTARGQHNVAAMGVQQQGSMYARD